MSILRTLPTLAEMQARHLLRRRLALVMLALLPAAFYLAVAGEEVPPGRDPWTLNVGGIGVAWAVAGASFFLALSARRVDERLILAGYRPVELLAGRLVFLTVLSVPVVVAYSVLLISTASVDAPVLVLAVMMTALIGVALGLAIASVLPSELEGTLALIAVVGVEMSIHGESAVAPFLPFYGPIKLIAVAWTGAGPAAIRVAHALVYTACLVGLATAVWVRRHPARASTAASPPG